MNLFNQEENNENQNIENKKNNNFSEIQEKYTKLRNEIEYHNNLYYNEDNPIISDMEYDFLIRELEELEQKYPELLEYNKNGEKLTYWLTFRRFFHHKRHIIKILQDLTICLFLI